MPSEREPVGLIAGHGRPAFLVAKGIKAAGRKLVIVALRGQASVRLKDLADEFVWAGVTRIGRWLRALRSRGVKEAVMIGGVKKREIYSPLRLLRYIPDVRTARLWYVRLRKDKRDNAVLLAVADELQKEGIELVSSVKYCREHLADEGLMTQTPVPRAAEEDVAFGWRIARASAELDIGQSVAVKERDQERPLLLPGRRGRQDDDRRQDRHAGPGGQAGHRRSGQARRGWLRAFGNRPSGISNLFSATFGNRRGARRRRVDD